MEVVPYFLSIIAVVVAFYWSAREYRRKPGTPTTGLFSYHEARSDSVARLKAKAEDAASSGREASRRSARNVVKPASPHR